MSCCRLVGRSDPPRQLRGRTGARQPVQRKADATEPVVDQEGDLIREALLETEADEVAPGDARDVEVWRALGKASKALKFGSDVHVSADGAEVLSERLPRTADDVEAWLDAQRAAGPRLPG